MNSEAKKYFKEIDKLTKKMIEMSKKVSEDFRSIDKLGYEMNLPIYITLFNDFNSKLKALQNWNEHVYSDLSKMGRLGDELK